MSTKNILNSLAGDSPITDNGAVESKAFEKEKKTSFEEDADVNKCKIVFIIFDKETVKISTDVVFTYSNYNTDTEKCTGLPVNCTLIDDVLSALNTLETDKVVIVHNKTADKVNTDIIDFCKAIRRKKSDIELLELDSKDAEGDSLSISKALKPFSIHRYKNPSDYLENKGNTLCSLEEIMNADIKPVEWYVPDLLPKEGLVMLAAHQKTGKSMIVENFAFCLCHGLPFWNARLPKTEVLLVDFENSPNILKERFEEYYRHYQIGDTKDGRNLSILGSIPRLTVKDGDSFYDALDDMLLDKPNIQAIIVDSIKSIRTDTARNANLHDHDEMQALNKWATDNHKLVIVTNHLVKGPVDANEPFSSIEGTNSVTGGVTMSLIIYKNHLSGKYELKTNTRICESVEREITKDGIFWSLGENLSSDETVRDLPDKDILQALDLLVNQSPSQKFVGKSKDVLNALEDKKGFNAKNLFRHLKAHMTLTRDDGKHQEWERKIELYNIDIHIIKSGPNNRIIVKRI